MNIIETVEIRVDEETTRTKEVSEKLSEIEATILRTNQIIDFNETDKIHVPKSEFAITDDDLVPEILFKKFSKNLEKIQNLAVKYLKSVTPAPQLVIGHKPPILRRTRLSV